MYDVNCNNNKKKMNLFKRNELTYMYISVRTNHVCLRYHPFSEPHPSSQPHPSKQLTDILYRNLYMAILKDNIQF